MLATIIAVLGTLLGAVVAGVFQQRTAHRAERAATTEQLRRDRLNAVTELAAAASDHRRAMWMRETATLNNEPADRIEELRAASYVTRSAITRPLVAVQVLLPEPAVSAAAKDMVSATYSMREHRQSSEALDAARKSARTAHDRFVTAAAEYLTP
jgi:hypothetical protein